MSGSLATLRLPALALGRATLGGVAGNLVGAVLLAGTIYGLASGRYRRWQWPTFPAFRMPNFHISSLGYWTLQPNCGGVWNHWYLGSLNCQIETFDDAGLGTLQPPGFPTAASNVIILRPPHRYLTNRPVAFAAADAVRKVGAPAGAINTPVHSPAADDFGSQSDSPPIGWLAPYPEPGSETRNRAVPGAWVPPRLRAGRRGLVVRPVPHAYVEGGRFVADGFPRPRRAPLPLTAVMPVRQASRPSRRAGAAPAMAYASTDEAQRDRSGDLVLPAYALPRPGEASRPVAGNPPVVAPGVEAGAVPQSVWAAQLTAAGPVAVARAGATPAPRGEKEIKVAFREASAFASTIRYNFTTEVRDFVQSLWDNIPDDCKKFRSKRNLRGRKFRNIPDPRTRLRPGDPNAQPYIVQGLRKPGRPTLARMMQDVYNHVGCIQWQPWNEVRPRRSFGPPSVRHRRGALLDLDLNQIEDGFYGGMGIAAKNASKRLGLTGGLQFGGGVGWGGKLGSQLGAQSPVDWAANLMGI